MRRLVVIPSLLFTCLATALWLGGSRQAGADSQENRVWMLVAFDGARKDGGPTLVNGSIDKDTLQKVKSGEMTGLVEIQQVFWKNSGQLVYQEIRDKDIGLTDVTLVKAERIIYLNPLTPDYVKRATSKEAKDRALKLSPPGD